jgi:spore maturation protein CgeB
MLGELTGLQDGVHYIIWHTVDELLEQIAYYMKYPAKARAIAQQASRFVHEHHSFDNRVRSVLTDIIEAKQWQSVPA